MGNQSNIEFIDQINNSKMGFNNIQCVQSVIGEIENLKNQGCFEDKPLTELQKLPKYNGVFELSYDSKNFYMLNISNDDAVPLKYLWRDKYESYALKLWYEWTRDVSGVFFDIGAHTGIYSIIGNLNKSINNIISFEPYFLNFSRLMSNLRLNLIPSSNCFFYAVSDTNEIKKFNVPVVGGYHTSGGRLSENGQINVNSITLDSINIEKPLVAMKIDTEGHEYEVLKGGINHIKKHKPKILFEVNKNNFDSCLQLLKKCNYEFHFIDEYLDKLHIVKKFNENLIRPEGSNCLAIPK